MSAPRPKLVPQLGGASKNTNKPAPSPRPVEPEEGSQDNNTNSTNTSSTNTNTNTSTNTNAGKAEGAPAEDTNPNTTANEDGNGGEDEYLPLQNPWTLYFNPGKSGKILDSQQYEDALRVVGEFETVGQFWCIFNNIEPIKSLSDSGGKAHYQLFKSGIKPMWEDPENKGGGTWRFMLDNSQASHLNQFWENIVLGLIGETIDEGSDVNGAGVQLRPGGDRIEVWIKATTEEKKNKIGDRIREALAEGIDRTMNPINLSFLSEQQITSAYSRPANPHSYSRSNRGGGGKQYKSNRY